MRPSIIEEHLDELAGYQTTRSALQFPLNRPIPISLIEILARDGLKMHEAGEDDSHARGKKRGTRRDT